MKPHPRIRKTVKWGGAVVTVLLVVVWIGSGWWSVIWEMPPHGTEQGFCRGCVQVEWGRRPWLHVHPENPWIEGGSFDLQLWIDYRFRRSSSPQIVRETLLIPVWIPAVSSLVLCVAAWRLDTLARRRARLNLCPKCNYDRTGIAARAVCPECGTAPSSSSTT